MSSIFSFFQRSWYEVALAMNFVLDSRIVSMTRSLLARRDYPVSVRSAIASTRSGAFTSVAPQENSTSALTPCLTR